MLDPLHNTHALRNASTSLSSRVATDLAFDEAGAARVPKGPADAPVRAVSTATFSCHPGDQHEGYMKCMMKQNIQTSMRSRQCKVVESV